MREHYRTRQLRHWQNPYRSRTWPCRLSERSHCRLHHGHPLVHDLMEAKDETRLLRFQTQFAKSNLLLIDAPGFVPLSKKRRRIPVRGIQPALRAWINLVDKHSALRWMGRGVRIRAPDWCLTRPSHPSRSYTGDEQRQLPPEPKPKTAEIPKNLTTEIIVDPVGLQTPPTPPLLWTTGTTRNTA